MRLNIKICDRCGSAENVHEFSKVVGRRSDPAGSMEDDHEDVELCHECAARLTNKCLNLLDKDVVISLFKSMRDTRVTSSVEKKTFEVRFKI